MLFTESHSLIQVTSSRLHELEQERLQMQEERELLSRQQDAMREQAGPRELRMYLSISHVKDKRYIFYSRTPTSCPHS